MYDSLIFVDVEAPYGVRSPATGNMTEFGAVHYTTRTWFHGHGYSQPTMDSFTRWLEGLDHGKRHIFVSDNPAYDWQWINFYYDKYGMPNPFGHSARRISDYFAGLCANFSSTQAWKGWRRTPHDHNPVNDAMGNCEAFEEMEHRAKGQRALELALNIAKVGLTP